MPKTTSTTRARSKPRNTDQPNDPHHARLKALRDKLKHDGADAMLVTNPVDVGYLTGFLGGDSYLIVPPSKKPVLISDRRYVEELQAFKHLFTIVMRDGQMPPAVGKQLARLGFDDTKRKPSLLIQADHLTLQALDQLKKLGLKPSNVPARVITPSTGIIAAFRAIKDQHEVALIRKAARIQEAALQAILPTITPGQSELEISARLEAEMKSRGSTQPAFLPIVAAKANSSKPHYAPDNTKTAKNKPLLIDWGATYRGYRSDMTRTFNLGRWSSKMAEIYDIVLEAHLAAADAIKPGAKCSDVDHAARSVIAKAGYAKEFGHSLGHGIGMNVHEAPSLAKASNQTLEPGHVVTNEPGIYLPGIGGVRIEDDYLVTDRGNTNLSKLSKTRDDMTL